MQHGVPVYGTQNVGRAGRDAETHSACLWFDGSVTHTSPLL